MEHSLKSISVVMLMNLMVLVSTDLRAQPFQIGHTTITFTDVNRGNRSIPAEIYYPADTTGDDVPLSLSTTAKFPALSFGHGFVMTWDAYQNIWSSVVPQGFIIVFPKTEGSISPSHLEFAKDLAFALSQLKQMGMDSTSLFYSRVDTINAVMGHSMGGGAAFLAAQLDPSIKALATLSPAETNPSAIQAAVQLAIPAIVFAGSNDCVTPPPVHQEPMYDSLSGSCKMLLTLLGGSHCQMAENNTLCNLGEATCLPPPSITRSYQHFEIEKYLLPWLLYTLNGDCNAASVFEISIASDTSVDVRRNCTLCNISSISGTTQTGHFNVFPNPFLDNFFIHFPSTGTGKITVALSALDGQQLFQDVYTHQVLNDGLEIDWGRNLSPGIYLLRMEGADGVFIRKMMKYN
jgi:pimeloyl-ACP methyl ester carboxylesterase